MFPRLKLTRYGLNNGGHMNVRVNCRYVFNPVGLDIWDARTDLQKGDIVEVKAIPGCPAPGTMGHCHVYHEGHFAGLVLVNSLEKMKRG
jgi:hypothetical protein